MLKGRHFPRLLMTIATARRGKRYWWERKTILVAEENDTGGRGKRYWWERKTILVAEENDTGGR
ncbi:MAG: hypothetical protein IKQ07_01670, partial [Bacteroidaceae bacterium]|nr:hypothetical protein [Bacteroidaceae bacterium]